MEPHLDLGLRQKDVERYGDRSEAEDPEVRRDVVRGVREPDRDSVSCRHPLSVQSRGSDCGATIQLAVRDPIALEEQRRPLGMLGGAVSEDAGEIHERRDRRA